MKGLKVDGINITSNNEPSAGQLVFHSHVHIVPRLETDGFRHWQGKRGYEENEEAEIGKIIEENI
jgi:histidine triad (HIT) family protein